MAAFNKAENEAVVSTGLSNASRGRSVDQSLGSLFEGVGNALQAGLSAYDESTRVKIQVEADQAVNGPNGAVAAATPDANGNLPPGSDEYLGNIAGLKTALSQGLISKNVYDTRLAVEAKRLRSSVPAGYGMFVDQALSSASGSSTANQALQTRLATIDQLQRQGSAEVDEVKNWMLKSDVNDLLRDPVVMETFRRRSGGMTVDQMVQSPDPSQFANLQLSVAQRKAVKSEYDLWEMETKRGAKVTSDGASLAVDKILVDSIYSNVDGPMSDYLGKLAEFQKPDSDGGIEFSGEERTQITALFSKVKIDAYGRLNKSFIEGRVDDTDREKMKSRLEESLKPYEDALVSENFGALNALVKSNAQNMDIALKKLYGSDKAAAAMAVGKKAGMPDQVLFSLYEKYGDGTATEAALLDAGTALAVSTGTKSFTDTVGVIAETRENAGPAVKGLMGNLTKILNTPVNTPEGVANAAINIFSSKNRDMLNSIDPANRVAAFEQLLSPVVIQKLTESGNAEALEFAQQWGISQFDAITKYAKDTVYGGQQDRYGVNITFDGKQFVAVPRKPTTPEVMTSMTSGVWEAGAESKVYRAVSDLNRYIKVMEPLWAKDGDSPGTALARMQWEDINSVGKTPPLMKQLGDAIWNSISGAEGKQSNAGAISGTAQASIPKGEKTATNEELTAQAAGQSLPDADAGQLLGFISKAEGADYNTLFGGSKVDLSGMTVAEVQQMQRKHGKKTGSSATGAYQVMRRTLSDLIDADVVDPDEKFTPAVQDRIAMALLKRRGYDDWQSGKLSTEEFANRLANEWASLPTSSGKSAYHGDSMGNKATRSRGKLVAMLDNLKSN
jgi:muramidase (phage lysozyme)